MKKSSLAILIIISVLLFSSISALVYSEINSRIRTHSSVIASTRGDSFDAREWVPIEILNTGSKPIYYMDSQCGCAITSLKKGAFGFEEPKGCLECLKKGGTLLNPGEKARIYKNIHFTGTYKIRIPYSSTNDLDSNDLSSASSVETNEFEITENSCSPEPNTELCSGGRGMYKVLPNCEYQQCVD